MRNMIDSPLAFETLDDFISNFSRQNQQDPSPHTQYLRLMVGQVAYQGIPLNVFEIKGVKHVLMIRSGSESEYSLINLSQVDAISLRSNESAVDALFKNPADHYYFEGTPSIVEINNKAAALEIKFAVNGGPRRMRMIWSAKSPEPEERFYVNAVLRQLEFFADMECRPDDAKMVARLNELLIEFSAAQDLCLSQEDKSHIRIVVGMQCKITHIYQMLRTYFLALER